ncbi:FUSC family protein [Micromonospora costi]|uniref:FUSC family protein n=1 Tax=Micromonospora costi TaxID=1530042 RepID=UPI001319DD97|nr:FUSC family protein [Micromonospora costi]
MLGTGLLRWVHHRDPGYVAVRRAARLTLVVSTVFYGSRYGIGNPTLATYALFGAIAMGTFAQLPGSARKRAGILLAALPPAWVLIGMGTALAGNTWAAAAGMLVIGFVVAFAGVGGPRLIGLVGALQLFYILACFPPYQPQTLPERLIGVTLGVTLLAAAEVVLWPDPVPVSYRQRLADAADHLAAFLDLTRETLRGRRDPREREAVHRAASEALARLRLADLPAEQRPIAAGVEDRALRACVASMQVLLVKAARLAAEAPPQGSIPDVATRLLAGCADTTRTAGRSLRRGEPTVTLDDLNARIAASEQARPTSRDGTVLVPQLCVEAATLSVAEQVRILAISARVAAGAPADREDTAARAYQDLFADRPRHPWTLYWQQFRSHLTIRSAPFQSALRLAVALAAARVIAGVLALMHGFWVLLATLTVLRTSAVDTRTALRPAVLGTIGGAVVSGLLMLFANRSVIYVAALPVAMVLAFTVGKLLGPAWAQAFFTLLLTFVFAQLAPGGLQLAEARLVNVLLGGAVGVLAGVFMWPRGTRRELRRNAAVALRASGEVLVGVVEAVLGGERPDGALERGRRAVVLADASYAQYHAERPDPGTSRVDWPSVLAAGHHALQGAESTLYRNPPGCLTGWPETAAQLRGAVGRLRSAYDRTAEQLVRGDVPEPGVTPIRCVDELSGIRPMLDERGDGNAMRHLAEIQLLLANCTDGLTRLSPPAPLRPEVARPGERS